MFKKKNSLTIKDKKNISLTFNILLLLQGSNTHKVRTMFALKIIISIFVKISLILDLHLRQFYIVRIFVNTVARPVSQQLPTLPQHLISTPVFGGVRVARSFLYNVCSSLFILFHFLIVLSVLLFNISEYPSSNSS